ncbi:hypothetical protein NM688_g6829 [Phlebia brevispora]|uniref:Uncharacterized protein n=1 Tax=Phlebia brevispora TaxID=194682 RepID=A0ACC1SBZ1_9APHY|nr:hypothetical protein NM688_g6829 [Phlebia brevispora]
MASLHDESWRGTLTLASLEHYFNTNADIDSAGGPRNLTPLAAACRRGHLGVVTLLLDNPIQLADPDAPSEHGRSPLYYAVTSCPAATRIDIVRQLLKAGANPDSCTEHDSLDTPLMKAITVARDKELVRELLEHGASRDKQNNRGQTAEILAKGTPMEELFGGKEKLNSLLTAIVDVVISIVMLFIIYTNNAQIRALVERVANRLHEVAEVKEPSLGSRIEDAPPQRSQADENATASGASIGKRRSFIHARNNTRRDDDDDDYADDDLGVFPSTQLGSSKHGLKPQNSPPDRVQDFRTPASAGATSLQPPAPVQTMSQGLNNSSGRTYQGVSDNQTTLVDPRRSQESELFPSRTRQLQSQSQSQPQTAFNQAGSDNRANGYGYGTSGNRTPQAASFGTPDLPNTALPGQPVARSPGSDGFEIVPRQEDQFATAPANSADMFSGRANPQSPPLNRSQGAASAYGNNQPLDRTGMPTLFSDTTPTTTGRQETQAVAQQQPKGRGSINDMGATVRGGKDGTIQPQNPPLQSNPVASQDRSGRRLSQDFVTDLNRFIEESHLETFFPPGSNFMQILTEKAATLRREPTATLGSSENLKRLLRLSLYQSVIYCDDSSSMAVDRRLPTLRELVKRMVTVSTMIVSENHGVDLYFYNSTSAPRGLAASQIDAVFNGIRPSGSSSPGAGLYNKILKPFIQVVNNRGFDRPLLVTIITSSPPNPEKATSLKGVVMKFKEYLTGAGYDKTAVIYNICQIGDDAKAKDFLRKLKGERDIADVLHCTEDRLDEEYQALRSDERRLDEWLLRVMTAPIMGRDGA